MCCSDTSTAVQPMEIPTVAEFISKWFPLMEKTPVCAINLPLVSYMPLPLSLLCTTHLGTHFHHGEGAGAIGINRLVRELFLEVLRDQGRLLMDAGVIAACCQLGDGL